MSTLSPSATRLPDRIARLAEADSMPFYLLRGRRAEAVMTATPLSPADAPA